MKNSEAEGMDEILKNWFVIGAGIIAFLSVFVEISKVKINPISLLCTRIGTAFNKPTLDLIREHERVQRIEMEEFAKILEAIVKKQNEMGIKIDINEIKRIRAEIMAFSTSLSKMEDHNEEQFKTIIKLHDEYLDLLKSVGMENGPLDADFKYISKVYQNCKEAGKFYLAH